MNENTKRKKNCLNCKHGEWDSESEYGGALYFFCNKREDNGVNNLDANLCKESYRNKSKVCCDLRIDPIEVKCQECGCDDMAWPDAASNHVCFDCYCANEVYHE